MQRNTEMALEIECLFLIREKDRYLNIFGVRFYTTNSKSIKSLLTLLRIRIIISIRIRNKEDFQ